MYNSLSNIHNMARWELPQSLGSLLETTNIPQNQVNDIIDVIKYGTMVGASDGSLLPMNRIHYEEYTPPTVGSYGFILQDKYDKNAYIRGCFSFVQCCVWITLCQTEETQFIHGD